MCSSCGMGMLEWWNQSATSRGKEVQFQIHWVERPCEKWFSSPWPVARLKNASCVQKDRFWTWCRVVVKRFGTCAQSPLLQMEGFSEVKLVLCWMSLLWVIVNRYMDVQWYTLPPLPIYLCTTLSLSLSIYLYIYIDTYTVYVYNIRILRSYDIAYTCNYPCACTHTHTSISLSVNRSETAFGHGVPRPWWRWPPPFTTASSCIPSTVRWTTPRDARVSHGWGATVMSHEWW